MNIRPTIIPVLTMLISLLTFSCNDQSNDANTGSESFSEPMKRVVTVLQTEGWANTPRAVALVEEYAKRIKLDISVEQIVIKNQEDVQSYKFIGSPTIRINGLDVDPTARSVTQYGITWRLIDWMQDASSIEKVLHAAFVEAGWINA